MRWASETAYTPEQILTRDSQLLDAYKVFGHIYPEQLDGDDLPRMIEKLHAFKLLNALGRGEA